MKILHVNTSDSRGGAARAAYRIHQACAGADIDSSMLVKTKTRTDLTIEEYAPAGTGRIIQSKIASRLNRFLLNSYHERDSAFFSVNRFSERVSDVINRIKPDIVHLHWINHEFISVKEIGRINRPLVWTLHDSWPFTGGCHVPFDCKKYQFQCGDCPQLHSGKENDLSRSAWKQKKRFWDGLDLRIVTPSRWMGACAQSSSLFHMRETAVIPNPIDCRVFQPADKIAARKILNLPEEKKLILFGAMHATSVKNKGFHLLIQAAQKLGQDLKKHAEAVIFGADRPREPQEFGIPARYVGELNDEISLALLYSAADVTVVPSLSENFPNSALESIACGTPVAAFRIGGIPDLIDHQKNGFLAAPYESDQLASGIEWILTHADDLSLCSSARNKALQFDYANIGRQYLNMYSK